MLPYRTVAWGCPSMATRPNRALIASVSACGRRPVTRISKRDVMAVSVARGRVGSHHPGHGPPGGFGRRPCRADASQARCASIRMGEADDRRPPQPAGVAREYRDAELARSIGHDADRREGAGSAATLGPGGPPAPGEPAVGGWTWPLDRRGVSGRLGKDHAARSVG